MEQSPRKYVLILGVIVVVILATFLILSNVQAATYTVTCTAPTARTDGSPFNAGTELDHYNWFVDGSLDGTSTTCTYVVDKSDGDYMVTATTVDTASREGPQSPGKSISLTTAPPNPPVLK